MAPPDETVSARAAASPMPCVGPDAVAMAFLRAGDLRGAAAEVIRVHGPRVREYLRAVLRDRDVADDAFSLFEEWTLAGIASYQATASLRTWCLGVAYNAVRRVREDAFRRRCVRMRSDTLGALAAQARTSSNARREREALRLEELRRSLSPDEQNLLALRLEQRLDWREVALVLSQAGEVVTAQALRKRFERLKERIGRLARDGGYLE